MKKDLLTEKETLVERAENTKKLEVHEDNNSKKRFEQCKRRLARNLIEENRVKRCKAISGAPKSFGQRRRRIHPEGHRG
jgi:hypothetical protein